MKKLKQKPTIIIGSFGQQLDALQEKRKKLDSMIDTFEKQKSKYETLAANVQNMNEQLETVFNDDNMTDDVKAQIKQLFVLGGDVHIVLDGITQILNNLNTKSENTIKNIDSFATGSDQQNTANEEYYNERYGTYMRRFNNIVGYMAKEHPEAGIEGFNEDIDPEFNLNNPVFADIERNYDDLTFDQNVGEEDVEKLRKIISMLNSLDQNEKKIITKLLDTNGDEILDEIDVETLKFYIQDKTGDPDNDVKPVDPIGSDEDTETWGEIVKLLEDHIVYFKNQQEFPEGYHEETVKLSFVGDEEPTKYYTYLPDTIDKDGIVYYYDEQVLPDEDAERFEIQSLTYKGHEYTACVEVYPESIEIEGVTYYYNKPENPGPEYIEVTIVHKGHTYYGYVLNDEEYPESITINDITYYRDEPENPGDLYYRDTVDFHGHEYVAYIPYPETIKDGGIIYYRDEPADPGERFERRTMTYHDREYVGYEEIYPESIIVDGITYYYNEPENPGDTHYKKGVERDGHIYTAYIEYPETVTDDNDVVYYFDEPANPGPRFEKRTYEFEGHEYSTYVEVYPETVTDDNDVVYYFDEPANPGPRFEKRIYEYEGHEYSTYVEVYPETIEVEGVTYYFDEPANPGEGYDRVTHTYNGHEYVAYVEHVDLFAFYAGADEPNANNFDELVTYVKAYPTADAPYIYTTPAQFEPSQLDEDDIASGYTITTSDMKPIWHKAGMTFTPAQTLIATIDEYNVYKIEGIDKNTSYEVYLENI